MEATINVYVPRPGSYPATLIKPGSGIVGHRRDGADYVDIWYEGNLYGAENLATHDQRIYHALSRMVTRYPTTARARVGRSDLIVVGTWDNDRQTLVPNTDADAQQALQDWLAPVVVAR